MLTSTAADFDKASKLFSGKAEVHCQDFKGLGWDDVILYNYLGGLDFNYQDAFTYYMACVEKDKVTEIPPAVREKYMKAANPKLSDKANNGILPEEESDAQFALIQFMALFVAHSRSCKNLLIVEERESPLLMFILDVLEGKFKVSNKRIKHEYFEKHKVDMPQDEEDKLYIAANAVYRKPERYLIDGDAMCEQMLPDAYKGFQEGAIFLDDRKNIAQIVENTLDVALRQYRAKGMYKE